MSLNHSNVKRTSQPPLIPSYTPASLVRALVENYRAVQNPYLDESPYRPISALEPANVATLDAMRDLVDNAVKDWHTYQRQAVDFHVRNAAAWANAQTGCDLADQVHPDLSTVPMRSLSRSRSRLARREHRDGC